MDFHTNPAHSLVEPVLAQHAAGAAMLWILRRGAIGAPHYSLEDLARLDGRLQAHLDGLRIAGEQGWNFVKEELMWKEPGEFFTAAELAFESGNPARLEPILALSRDVPDGIPGVVSALGWLPFERARSHIDNLVRSTDVTQQRIGIAAAAVHRHHAGEVLARFTRSEHAPLRARALKAVGESGDASLAAGIEGALRDPDPVCRYAAGWSGALLGLPAALPVLREIAESDFGDAAAAAGLALRRMDLSAAQSWQKRLAGDPKRVRLAILCAGLIGDPEPVTWLISLFSKLPLARLAGEAFTMITGVDLAYRDLERKPPEDFNAGPTEDPKDENVEMDPDDNLPWPDPALVQKWWDKNRAQFQTGTRYLMGKPMSIDWLKVVLRDGRQRQRTAAALELAIRQPGQPLFNVAAPGFRQQQILGKGEVIR